MDCLSWRISKCCRCPIKGNRFANGSWICNQLCKQCIVNTCTASNKALTLALLVGRDCYCCEMHASGVQEWLQFEREEGSPADYDAASAKVCTASLHQPFDTLPHKRGMISYLYPASLIISTTHFAVLSMPDAPATPSASLNRSRKFSDSTLADLLWSLKRLWM